MDIDLNMNGGLLPKRKVYVAGPYTDPDIRKIDQNVKRAILKGDVLSAFGFTPFIPHLFHHWDAIQNHGYEFWMKQCFEWLMGCDYMLVIDRSPGVDREIELAEKLGIPVFYEFKDLKAEILKRKIYIIVGNTAAGKTTIVNKLLDQNPHTFKVAKSFTTRPKRVGDSDRDSYIHISMDEARDMIDEDLFIEWTEFSGNIYGSTMNNYYSELISGYHVLNILTPDAVKKTKEKLESFGHNVEVLLLNTVSDVAQMTARSLLDGRSEPEIEQRANSFDDFEDRIEQMLSDVEGVHIFDSLHFLTGYFRTEVEIARGIRGSF